MYEGPAHGDVGDFLQDANVVGASGVDPQDEPQAGKPAQIRSGLKAFLSKD